MELSLENILNEVDKIPGGLAKGKTLDDIAKKHNVDKNELKKQLDKGIKVEAEHTTDKAAAKEIVMDHLFEDPKYYDKLSKIDEGTCGYNADVKTGKEFKTPGGIKMRKDPYGLSAFAIELVKEFNNDVNEVGELTATPYNYFKRTDDLELDGDELFGTVVYDFSADDIFYDVIFEYDYDSELGKNIVKVDFTANESYEMTNTNEPYKIMATIFSIIKKELARDIVKNNLDILLYTPAETKTKGGEAVRLRGINQRNELYKAFFKKNIPHVKMEETPNETRFYLKENQLNEAVRCKALYNTPQNELVPYIKSLTQFMDENLELRPLPKVKFVDDEANASKVLGKTAYYDPQNCAITLYITDRHPKDILRSFAHEMIHHMQNMQGRLGNIGTQNVNQDDNLKGLEEEAYQLGNILLRSWENSQDQLDEIKLQPKSTGVGSRLKVNFKLDPSYFFYPKDIKSINDVNERHFGGWVSSKDLPKMQGMLHRDDSSMAILTIILTNTNTPYEHLEAWKDKLDNLKIPYTDKILTQGRNFGITGIDINKYIILNIEQPTNEIKLQPKNTGVAGALTPEEKEWISNEIYNIDIYYPSNNTDPDTPLEYTFINKEWIEDNIEREYMTFKDLEIFNSIHRKLKNRIYTFNWGHDPNIEKYPEDYDLRDAVVRSDYDNNNPELTITISDRPDGSRGSEYGAFDKDTGEYLKYSDLDKIGKVNEIKIQPGSTGTSATPLTPEEKEWIKKQVADFEVSDTPQNPDEPLIYPLINKNWIIYKFMTPKDLELHDSIHDSIYRKLKNKVYTLNRGYDNQVNNYPQLRNTVIKANTERGNLDIILSDADDNDKYFGAFDKTTGEYIKYSGLNEIKIQPKKTGVKGKINLEFFPKEPKIKSYSDILNFLSISPKNFIPGIIKLKDFPLMFAEIFTNSEGEISMDLEAPSNHPERYDIWVQRLKDLGIPFKINHPYIDDINVEKNFNIEVNPIS